MIVWRKYTGEVLVRAFDFADEIALGDTISSATASMAAGDVNISRVTWAGSVVTFWLAGGTGPSLQPLRCLANTATGETLEGQITIQVLP